MKYVRYERVELIWHAYLSWSNKRSREALIHTCTHARKHKISSSRNMIKNSLYGVAFQLFSVARCLFIIYTHSHSHSEVTNARFRFSFAVNLFGCPINHATYLKLDAAHNIRVAPTVCYRLWCRFGVFFSNYSRLTSKRDIQLRDSYSHHMVWDAMSIQLTSGGEKKHMPERKYYLIVWFYFKCRSVDENMVWEMQLKYERVQCGYFNF